MNRTLPKLHPSITIPYNSKMKESAYHKHKCEKKCLEVQIASSSFSGRNFPTHFITRGQNVNPAGASTKTPTWSGERIDPRTNGRGEVSVATYGGLSEMMDNPPNSPHHRYISSREHCLSRPVSSSSGIQREKKKKGDHSLWWRHPHYLQDGRTRLLGTTELFVLPGEFLDKLGHFERNVT